MLDERFQGAQQPYEISFATKLEIAEFVTEGRMARKIDIENDSLGMEIVMDLHGFYQ